MCGYSTARVIDTLAKDTRERYYKRKDLQRLERTNRAFREAIVNKEAFRVPNTDLRNTRPPEASAGQEDYYYKLDPRDLSTRD